MDASGQAGLYYKHSGRFSVTGALYAVVVGSVVACLCAFVYAYIIVYCPIVYLNALIAAGFGALIGYLCSTMLQKKNVRSSVVAVAISLLVTTIGYYFSWAAWVWALARRSDNAVPFAGLVGLTISPSLLWETIRAINVEGVWSIGRSSTAVTGWALWAVWVAELGLIFGLALSAAYKTMDEQPFCEGCEAWGTKKEKVLEALVTDTSEFRQRMEAKDFRYLESAGAPTGESTEWQRIDLFSCPKCGSFHTMDSTRVKIKVESGKRKEETKQTVHHLLLTASEADALHKLGQKMAPPLIPPVPEPPQGVGASA